MTLKEGKMYDNCALYQGGKDLVDLAVSQQEAAQAEAAQAEAIEQLVANVKAVTRVAREQRVNPELMVHGHVKQGDPEPVTIYKSDPGEDDVSELYQTAVQVGDTTRLIDIDFTQPGLNEEILLAIVRDRLVSSINKSENVRMANLAITVALAYLQ